MSFDPVAIRRKLHAAPELSREEHATSAFVAELLEGWGYDVARGVGGTGVVATLRNGAGERIIGLRADMDALPITEATGAPYASAHPGVMHACGHDGHTTILLAAAKELAETRDFSGTVRLVFQPAEEVGGAVEMLADGLFERFPVDVIFAMHNWPNIPAGEFRFLAGPTMASVDLVIITITGQGGHGARPHETVDPIVAASSLVLALQTIVSRNVDPLETAVITVGMIHGGTLPNVIPDKVELQITTRAFTDAVRDRVRARIKVLAEAHAASYGATADVFHPPGFPALVNHDAETAFARQVAVRHFGEDVVGTAPLRTGSEDFAFMLQKKVGSYLFVGNGPSADLHSPRYDFNDAIIAPASRYWVALVKDYLAANS
ncbi:MAG: amidohydrolase [Devosia sp.]|uniref:M20 aminoacylase family protein n=1 Tax=Devosia sp. 66-22 TaxID=1895753 RepID=UPI000928266C|nr:M20 aminoacylase family protein [Devosia sp. 66-22]MBN9348015.1 amidohydrolase [Devosia sp.]OJX54563.1 MAG: amidohydrolase [Devosia sp. 66-22]